MSKVVLDTNVLISALLFGGVPRRILGMILSEEIVAITSPILIMELLQTLKQKFGLTDGTLAALHQEISESFVIITPEITLTTLKDVPDNRVLEAAVEGKCGMVVTGDKKFLALRVFRNITIISPREFYKLLVPHR